MKKYSRELINRYINSEDITIYDIDDLMVQLQMEWKIDILQVQ